MLPWVVGLPLLRTTVCVARGKNHKAEDCGGHGAGVAAAWEQYSWAMSSDLKMLERVYKA